MNLRRFGPEDADKARAYLERLTQEPDTDVRTLLLGGCPLTDEDWPILAAAIKSEGAPGLVRLDLDGTGLTPARLGELSDALGKGRLQLESLTLDGNPLGPNGLAPLSAAALPQLEYFWIRHCGLREIPPALCLLPSLRYLAADGNPLQSPPIEHVASFSGDFESNAKAARAFADNVAAAMAPLPLQVSVAGPLGSGKTSLLRALMGERPTGPHDHTVGVERVAWTPPSAPRGHRRFLCRRVKPTEDDQPQHSEVVFWDHGGAEAYASIHHLFWQRCVLLVWDASNMNDDDGVAAWLHALQASVPGATVQLVAAKMDLVPRHLRRGRLSALLDSARRFDVAPDVLPVSALSGRGVKALRRRVLAFPPPTPTSRPSRPVPVLWTAVRGFLQTLRAGGELDAVASSLVESGRPFVSVAAAQAALPHVSPATFEAAVRWLGRLGEVQRRGDVLLLDRAWLADALRPLVAHDGPLRWPGREALEPLWVRGVLTPEAQAVLWGGDAAEANADALQRLGAVVAIPGGEPPAQLLVCARLPTQPPRVVADWLWPAGATALPTVELARKLVMRAPCPAGLAQAAMAACSARASILHGWRAGFLCVVDDLSARVDVGEREVRVAVRAPLRSLAAAWATLRVAAARVAGVLADAFPGLAYSAWAQCGACLLQGRSPALDVLAAAPAGACSQCAAPPPGLFFDVGASAETTAALLGVPLSPLVRDAALPAALAAELAAAERAPAVLSCARRLPCADAVALPHCAPADLVAALRARPGVRCLFFSSDSSVGDVAEACGLPGVELAVFHASRSASLAREVAHACPGLFTVGWPVDSIDDRFVGVFFAALEARSWDVPAAFAASTARQPGGPALFCCPGPPSVGVEGA